MTHPLVTPDMIETYRRDGVVLVRGLFKDHVDTLRREIALTLRNGLHDSGVYLSEYLRAHRIERARVVVSQLLLYEDEADDFGVVDAMAGTEHVVLFRGEVRQVDSFMEDQRGFHAAVGEENAAAALRQIVSVFGHFNVS